MKSHNNCHHHTCTNSSDIKNISKVLVIIVIFMCVELWGHFRTKSLSLLADALHLVVDISGLIVSIITLKIAKRNQTAKMPWGYQRVEILGALTSVALIWVAVGYLIIESIHKYLHPEEIDGQVFLGISIIGLIVNLSCIWVLHGGGTHIHKNYSAHTNSNHSVVNNTNTQSTGTAVIIASDIPLNPLANNPLNTTLLTHKNSNNTKHTNNLNVRATYIHLIGDVVQSLGVICASTIIYFYPKMVMADALCTVLFAILVLASTLYVVRDALLILIDAAPESINQDEIKDYVLNINTVIKIEDLKVWSISVNKYAVILKILTDHILINEYEQILKNITDYLQRIPGIDVVNVQINTPCTTKNTAGFVCGGIALNETVY